MLQQGKPTPKLQEWYDRLAPVVEEARAALRQVQPSKLVLRSGCEQDADGNFRLSFFWREVVISGGDFAVRRADTGDEMPSFIQSLVLTYLVTADGATPSSRWIGFRELPDGMFYAQAFQGYSGGRLVRELEGGVEAFHRAAERLGGELLAVGDAGYIFTVLPRVHLALVYWEGDEEFPSQAQVLFEDSASHYLPTDGLAILGSQLVGKILKAAQ
ncbi:MAG: DUF3786 domain-containing protein [Anaerolineae bacterium]|jgi:hypothetical protein|nr:DUF3786 domain-containing protein [Anaerolineae bacterium]